MDEIKASMLFPDELWYQEVLDRWDELNQKYILPAIRELNAKLIPGVHYDFDCEKEEHDGKVIVTLTATPTVPRYFSED